MGQIYLISPLSSHFLKRFYLFIFREREREGEREGEKHQCVVASLVTPTGDLAHNPDMCPDWEWNCDPLVHSLSIHWATPARALFIFKKYGAHICIGQCRCRPAHMYKWKSDRNHPSRTRLADTALMREHPGTTGLNVEKGKTMDIWHYRGTMLCHARIYLASYEFAFSHRSPAVRLFPTLHSRAHPWCQQRHSLQTVRLRGPLLRGHRARDVQKHFPGVWTVRVTRADDEVGDAVPVPSGRGASAPVTNQLFCVAVTWGCSSVRGAGQKPFLLYLRAIWAGAEECRCTTFGRRCGNIYRNVHEPLNK